MTRTRTTLLSLAALCIGTALTIGIVSRHGFLPWSKDAGEVRSGLGTEILFMPTPGGLLEVSKFQVTEQFDKAFVYSVLGYDVGRTVAHIRVPATYRYHIELAPRWQVTRVGDVFTVVTPPVKPSLPVAIDLAKMQKDVGGSWLLVPFNRTADLEALERAVTAKLAEKAGSPVYHELQRELARETVTQFVKKWLIQQESWQAAKRPRIEVTFRQ